MASTSCKSAAAQVCCPHHADAILMEDDGAGKIICSQCGIVINDQVLDIGAECRTSNNEEDMGGASLAGAVEDSLLEGDDSPTMITMGTGHPGIDTNSQSLKLKHRTGTSAFQEISTMADRLNLPQIIIDRANVLCEQARVDKSVKGWSNDGIGAACLYVACRLEEMTRSFNEISAVSNTSKKVIRHIVKRIKDTQQLGEDVVCITPDDFISRFCSKLQLSNAIQKASTHIAQRATELKLCMDKSPVSVAATAIYMASQASEDKKLAKDIRDMTGVAVSTIQRIYKLMYPEAASLFPEDFKFFTPIEQLPVH